MLFPPIPPRGAFQTWRPVRSFKESWCSCRALRQDRGLVVSLDLGVLLAGRVVDEDLSLFPPHPV